MPDALFLFGDQVFAEEVVERQSVDVDLVSGASESTSAFQDGMAAALARAQAAIPRAQ